MYSHWHVILHLSAKFRSNQTIVGGVMMLYLFFKMAAASHIGFDFGNVRPPTKCNSRSQLDPQIWFDPIYRFGDIAIFIFCRFGWKTIHAHFFGSFGGIFPPNMVTHRSNPKRTILAWNHVV